MNIYTHESLRIYEDCPLLYKYKYIEKLERKRQSVEDFLNERFRGLIHRLYSEENAENISLEELIGEFNDQWHEKYNKDEVVIADDRQEEEYFDLGSQAIKKYYQRYHPFRQGLVMGVEKKVMIDLDNKGKYIFEGEIRLLLRAAEGTYEIHEYDLAEDIPGKDYFEQDRRSTILQLGLQNIIPDAEKVSLAWHYVLFDKVITNDRSTVQLNNSKNELKKIVDRIEEDKIFQAKEFKNCGIYCAYLDLCPKRKGFINKNMASMLVRNGIRRLDDKADVAKLMGR